jgi:adenosylmethionine-8-amino-7-oxononanoate aminotransferase
LANLKLFKRTRLLNVLPEKVRTLQRALRGLRSLAHVGQVRQLGLMVGIELVRNKRTKEPYPLEDRIGHKVAMETRRQHLIIRPIGNILVLMPPLTATLQELNVMVEVVKLAIQSATRSPRHIPTRS